MQLVPCNLVQLLSFKILKLKCYITNVIQLWLKTKKKSNIRVSSHFNQSTYFLSEGREGGGYQSQLFLGKIKEAKYCKHSPSFLKALQRKRGYMCTNYCWSSAWIFFKMSSAMPISFIPPFFKAFLMSLIFVPLILLKASFNLSPTVPKNSFALLTARAKEEI